MRVFALDTAAAFGSMALVEDGRVVEELLLHAPEGFGAVLFDHIGRLLQRHGVVMEQIDVFAGAAGPGSFTGIRVGLAAIKGLAAVMEKPAAGISNLQALAECSAAPLRATVLDARRGEIYGAVYDSDLRVISPEVVTHFPAWLSHLPDGEIEFVSSDFAPFRVALAGTRFDHAPILDGQRALAGAIGRIAYRRALAGDLASPAEIDANYVRRSDAELFWKDA